MLFSILWVGIRADNSAAPGDSLKKNASAPKLFIDTYFHFLPVDKKVTDNNNYWDYEAGTVLNLRANKKRLLFQVGFVFQRFTYTQIDRYCEYKDTFNVHVYNPEFTIGLGGIRKFRNNKLDMTWSLRYSYGHAKMRIPDLEVNTGVYHSPAYDHIYLCNTHPNDTKILNKRNVSLTYSLGFAYALNRNLSLFFLNKVTAGIAIYSKTSGSTSSEEPLEFDSAYKRKSKDDSLLDFVNYFPAIGLRVNVVK